VMQRTLDFLSQLVTYEKARCRTPWLEPAGPRAINAHYSELACGRDCYCDR